MRDTATPEARPLEGVFVHVTRACNRQCAYCYCFTQDHEPPDELTRDECVLLLESLASLRPTKIVFTGGEPLLRSDIMDVLQAMGRVDPEHAILRCLNTNGVLLTRAMAQSLVGVIDEIRISLDGMQEANDANRGAGSYDAAIAALRISRDVGFEPKVVVTVTAKNAGGLERFLCFLLREGYKRIRINNVKRIGRAAENTVGSVDSRTVLHAVERAWARCCPDEATPLPRGDREPQYHCGVGRFMNILSNGDVYPCHALMTRQFLCGNIRKTGVVDIWQRSGLLERLGRMDLRVLLRSPAWSEGGDLNGCCLGSVLGSMGGLSREDTIPSLLAKP